jgi:putative ABC transport system permease protein
LIKNFFSVSLRNILRNRVYSVINILGLSVGLTAFLLIQLYVLNEKSFDQFHEKKHRIFRLQQDRYNQGELTNRSVTVCAAVGPAIADNFPQVERYVKILYSPAVITYGTTVFEESNFYFVSEDFFKVFSIPLIEGIDSLVLKRPGTVVLSRSMATKYFGNENPIGKVLDFRGIFKLEVTGVFEDIPSNSHMQLDFMGSFETYAKYAGERATTSWKWDAYYTYLLLDDQSDLQEIESSLPNLVQQHTGDWLKESNQDMEFYFQPLTDIHLHSAFKQEMKVNGNHKMVYYLSLIAYFIIVIAYINYVNVATAKSLERAKEVGIRKVLGGYRFQLMIQFLSESFIMNLMAVVISVLIVNFTIPPFADLWGRDINPSMMLTKDFLILLAGALLVGTLLAGLYPALVLSGFRPTEVLKGKLAGSPHGGLLRRSLVIMQFIASITLIICTYVVFQQIKFLRTQSLGFTMDEILVIHAPLKKDSLYVQQLNAFKEATKQIPQVVGMTAVREIPGAPIVEYANGIRRLGGGEDEVNQYQIISVDGDFMDVFNLTLIAGRKYYESEPADYSNIIINEKAVEVFGFRNAEEAINQKIVWPNDTISIIGVLKNYHHETLKFPMSPILFPLDPGYGSFLPVRIQGENVAEILDQLDELYQNYFPGNPFNAYFLNEYFEEQYKSDVRFGKVVAIFSSIAIIITCLGLFGLSSYTVVLRMKEIGIRKVLGASEKSIITLLCKDYTALIAVAIVISIPVAWYVMNGWLQSFANKIDLSAWLFVLPSLMVILVSWVTISSHVFRAAASNPIDTIRHD